MQQDRRSGSEELSAFQSLDAERSVLGALILSPQTMDAVMAEGLREEDFGSAAHRAIWRSACRMINGGGEADTVTLRNDLAAVGELESAGGVAYLDGLLDATPAAANAPHYARIVREKARARRLYQAAAEAMGTLRSGHELADARGVLTAAVEASVGNVGDTGGWIGDVLRAHVSAPAPKMISYGLDALDRHTGGLAEGVLCVVGAYSSTGKTSFATTVLGHMARKAVPVALFSLEMSRDQVAQTVLAREAGIPIWRLRRAAKEALNERDAARRAEVVAGMDVPLWIDEKPSTSAEIAAKTRLLARKFGVRAIAVDYLQLLTPNQREKDRRQEIDAHVQTLKRLARETGVSVMLLSQLARPQAHGGRGSATDNNPKPSVHALKESGAINDAADTTLLLWRPRFQQFEICPECAGMDGKRAGCGHCGGRGQVSTDNELQVIIGKDRFGEAGYPVKLDWDGQYFQISSRGPGGGQQTSAF